MQHIDAATTRRQLAFGPLIAALRERFAAGAEVPLRHTHPIGEAGTLLLMPAWRAGGRLGLKTVTIFPGNNTIGLPGLHSTYLLFDARTGVPLAQLDGNEITSRRTAAVAALAASYLARRDAHTLLIVGSGRVAALLAEAMNAVRPLQRVVVWNHRPASAQALAATLVDAGFDARATDDLAQAASDADLISCATLATTALIRAEWLRPGTHLDLIGSFTPQMREAEPACFARAEVFVDTPEALAKSGDLLDAVRAGTFEPARLCATLDRLCRGEHAGRADDAQITLFKSVGSTLADLAAAELVVDAIGRQPLS